MAVKKQPVVESLFMLTADVCTKYATNYTGNCAIEQYLLIVELAVLKCIQLLSYQWNAGLKSSEAVDKRRRLQKMLLEKKKKKSEWNWSYIISGIKKTFRKLVKVSWEIVFPVISANILMYK